MKSLFGVMAYRRNYHLSRKRKRGEESFPSKYHEKESEVDEISKELEKKHGSEYDVPKLRLWARMIASNLHCDMDSPPNIPAFNGGSSIRKPRHDLTNALTSAAMAVTHAITGHSISDSEASATAIHVNLRMKNFEQLRYLKQLLDDGILTDAEFKEQKENIMTVINKLK